jgi:hypothetical protein
MSTLRAGRAIESVCEQRQAAHMSKNHVSNDLVVRALRREYSSP